ncbi:DUF6629 family protein [Frigoriglobus tundricola]|uniref:Uncharacterized protein n=1 Tax=Frigoriglobus tundricola TaxID=2774151 RepID=A0A6M5YYN4_9BACT|nr:DUF6629 family protein [Frigoriglobus tundricola]QJW98968.1 hypothetical protein FTUN_6563 [Frigoriglobus tundricola]
MCFSPEASFAVGTALVPAGGYCLYAAWVKDPRLLPVALIPWAFAAQQLAEGFVWLGLRAGDAPQTRTAALVFLFFATAFWPWWFSPLNALIEFRPRRRPVFIVLTLLTTVWFWALYYPFVAGPEPSLLVEVVHHSIQYSYPDHPVLRFVSPTALRVSYLLSVAVPMMLGPNLFGRAPVLMLLGSAVAAAALFGYAFISVWCFFAAVLAGYLCVWFRHYPARVPVQT